jgi:translation initiation factor 1
LSRENPIFSCNFAEIFFMAVVYSTNPGFDAHEEDRKVEPLPPNKQKLVVTIDRRQRAGKQVTLVSGFVGDTGVLEALAKRLKAKCGVGGSAKDGIILIQGDFRDRVTALLIEAGYNAKRGN